MYGKREYKFQDTAPDSAFYASRYDRFNVPDTFIIKDRWQEITNDFSIYTFPDSKNLLQYFKVGASYQLLSGKFDSTESNLYNIWAHAEYRNRTRNKKWDVGLFGELYFAGYNAGNYSAGFQLIRTLTKPAAQLELGFRNINRTPAFRYDERSSFRQGVPVNLNNENITLIYGGMELTKLRLSLYGRYYMYTNYTYLENYYVPAQASSLFSMLQVGVSRKFLLKKHWAWYFDLMLQQKIGDAPINVPFLFTRNRFAYEGTIYKNLNLCTGFEFRYYTDYTADQYSPVLGHFLPQDSIKISNRPDIAAFVHFRIRSFYLFARAENLNTFSFDNGAGFTHNNLAAPLYPYPLFQLRVGFIWHFVN
jgi:Putative porin